MAKAKAQKAKPKAAKAKAVKAKAKAKAKAPKAKVSAQKAKPKAQKPKKAEPKATKTEPKPEKAAPRVEPRAVAAKLGTIRVTLTKSPVRRLRRHQACVIGLGLRRVGQTVEVEDSPAVRGMIDRVRYMVRVEEEA
ncbi:MAG: 50S ribosomal protein L30 [Gammaproteobacteria bacterium]|jgi:large subunit ribosomal protein L30